MYTRTPNYMRIQTSVYCSPYSHRNWVKMTGVRGAHIQNNQPTNRIKARVKQAQRTLSERKKNRNLDKRFTDARNSMKCDAHLFTEWFSLFYSKRLWNLFKKWFTGEIFTSHIFEWTAFASEMQCACCATLAVHVCMFVVRIFVSAFALVHNKTYLNGMATANKHTYTFRRLYVRIRCPLNYDLTKLRVQIKLDAFCAERRWVPLNYTKYLLNFSAGSARLFSDVFFFCCKVCFPFGLVPNLQGNRFFLYGIFLFAQIWPHFFSLFI